MVPLMVEIFLLNRRQMMAQRKYVVAVEWPAATTQGKHLIVVVADKVEDLGRAVLDRFHQHELPISVLRADNPKDAALKYIAEHGLAGEVARIRSKRLGHFREWEWRTEPGWALVE